MDRVDDRSHQHLERRRPRSRIGRAAVVSAGLVVLSACGGDAAESAEALIEGPLAAEIGLGDLAATCDQPDDLVRGETFDCTATTPDGATIEFVGELTSEDEINVQSANLLTEADVQAIVPAIAEAVGREVGADVAADDLTCPSGSIILDDDGDFTCEIVDRTTGDVYSIAIQTGGLDPGGGPRDLGFLIGDLIEP